MQKTVYDPGWGGSGNRPRTVDWTHDQHLASGWVTARVPAHFELRKSETRRERLTVRRGANGEINVVNGLGAEIAQLWLADRDGKIHTATKLAAGAQTALTETQTQATGAASGLRTSFSRFWYREFLDLEKTPETLLCASCYLAVLDAAPFVEEGLRKLKSRRARTLVYGIQPE